jgi:Sec-independent protein secretion pathway component TatC
MKINYLYTYYLEIKNRIFLSLMCWLFVTIVCYFYKETLLFLFISFSNYGVLAGSKPYFIFTDVTEIFSVYAQLIFFIANQILFIKLSYHMLMFLSLGLYKFEYTNLKFTFEVLLSSWIISICLLNKILMPLSWNFFLSFQDQTHLKTISLFFEAKLNEYFNFYISLYYVCLLNFMFFIFVALFINNISNDLRKIKSFRKIFYFVFVMFSTLTTPPDILSQLLLSFILILNYEILILIKIYKRINLVTN